AGPRGRKAHSELSGEFGISTGVERRRLLVPHLDEPDLLALQPQRLDHAVDAVSRYAEDRIDTPLDEGFDEHIRRSGCHVVLRHFPTGENDTRLLWFRNIVTRYILSCALDHQEHAVSRRG